MSRDGSIIRPFGDADHTFRMAWGDLIKLQEARDCGPLVLLERLHAGTWKVEDLREIIRIGLLGGGLEPAKALSLVKQYVEQRPPLETLPLAFAVLSAGLVWADDEAEEPPGKTKAPNGSMSDQTGSSASGQSLNPGS